ncbi:hypothetical protein PXJ20_04910 [Paraburkholderia sp. A1RI_3L]|uniref:hypothetical protein n=1 Tax=Paraburkholderia TaxID=1822464 RepID=UPI003B814006
MAEKLNSIERQRELRERFRQADATSLLEGYEPGHFEESKKERLIAGERSSSLLWLLTSVAM